MGEYIKHTSDSISFIEHPQLFSNVANLLKERKGIDGVSGIRIKLKDGSLAGDMKITFFYGKKEHGFFLKNSDLWKNFIPKGENHPSHEEVGVTNAIAQYIKKIDSKKVATHAELSELQNEITSA